MSTPFIPLQSYSVLKSDLARYRGGNFISPTPSTAARENVNCRFQFLPALIREIQNVTGGFKTCRKQMAKKTESFRILNGSAKETVKRGTESHKGDRPFQTKGFCPMIEKGAGQKSPLINERNHRKGSLKRTSRSQGAALHLNSPAPKLHRLKCIKLSQGVDMFIFKFFPRRRTPGQPPTSFISNLLYTLPNFNPPRAGIPPKPGIVLRGTMNTPSFIVRQPALLSYPYPPYKCNFPFFRCLIQIFL